MCRLPEGALYVHVPFCVSHCPYCDFYSVRYRFDVAERYIKAVLEEARRCIPKRPETIYIGGGNPTSLPSQLLARLIASLLRLCETDEEVEFTVETNPETLTESKAVLLRRLGVNRISIGVQSFSSSVLRFLGRGHGVGEGFSAVDVAKRVGFANINVDLIYGVPGQRLSDWISDLRTAVSMGLTHISCYALSVEEGTPLARAVRRRLVVLPPDDLVADMYESAVDLLTSAGYRRYEISNFAKEGYESRHNRVYWRFGFYVGLGPSAASFDGVKRTRNPSDLTRYISEPGVAEEVEELSGEQRAAECLILALRMTEGISEAELRRKTGYGFGMFREEIESFAEEGLLEMVDGRLRLTRRGFLFHDTLAAGLIR